jgi:hypothetical protein
VLPLLLLLLLLFCSAAQGLVSCILFLTRCFS